MWYNEKNGKESVKIMKYNVVSPFEFTYPDVWDYATGSTRADVFAPRGGYACFQLLLGDRKDNSVSVEVSGLPLGVAAEVYTMTPVQVERNHGISEEECAPHYPERKAPYWLYDCYRTFDGTLDLTGEAGGLYFALKVDANTLPGDYRATLTVDGEDIPVDLKIYSVCLPEETLKIIMGYSSPAVVQYHGVEPGSEEYFKLEEQYLAMLRRTHQNMMYTGGIRSINLGDNRWDFDFSPFVAQVKRYMAAGMKYFNAPAIGFRKSWSDSAINLCGAGIEALSYEGYCYLSQYLPRFREVLIENGWLDNFVMGIADEPNEANATAFRALCGLVRKLFPEMRLIDAMSYGVLHGALDIWVPLNAEYDKHMAEIETLRAAGDEIWHYVCCGPREKGYINRFMDYPLLSTLYLHWGNYKYDLAGYLHWAANCYQPGQDPFTLNCPEHHNADAVCYLPAGDTHIIYPGKDGPWMSARLEAERVGAEDYELLRLLAEKDKSLADGICDRVFRSFADVEYDVSVYTAAKRELLEALSE
ncbi:MAG: DUF4091 domain-containing protein [Ruminococcaceae bacterium]|nr:DUF4091 domain-containing protein [Oscillospiraceae bacterium]